MIVIVTLYPIGVYSGVTLDVSTLVAFGSMSDSDNY